MVKFKEGDKVKVMLFNPFTFGNRRWVDGVVVSFMSGFTELKDDGREYYSVDLKGIGSDNKDVRYFASSDGMFKEGEELPDIDALMEAFIKEIKEKSVSNG